MIYFYKTYLIIKKHQNQRDDFFSTNKNTDITWIPQISILLFLSILLNVLIHSLGNRIAANQHLLIALSYFIFSVFFWLLGYNGISQHRLYPVDVDKYEDTKENQATLQSFRLHKKAFLSLIEKRKIHLNPEVNIYDFCLQLNTNRTYLSSMINNEFNMNFRTLINKYRIDEAKNLISQNNIDSLDFIATKCGFQYYTTFARVFKQIEGCSPQEFKKKIYNSSKNNLTKSANSKI